MQDGLAVGSKVCLLHIRFSSPVISRLLIVLVTTLRLHVHVRQAARTSDHFPGRSAHGYKINFGRSSDMKVSFRPRVL